MQHHLLNKIKKAVFEFVLLIIITTICLTFMSSVNAAYGNEIHAGSYMIADTQAGSPPPATPDSPAAATPPINPDRSGEPPPAAPPANPPAAPSTPGTVYSPTNPAIPLSTTGYEDLQKLTKTGSPTEMLNQFVQGIFINLKYILGAIAIMFIVLSGVKMVIAGDQEEVVTAQKKAITYGIIGLAVIGFSSEVAKVFSVACPPGTPECSQGGFLSQPSSMIMQSGLFTRNVQIVITFIKYLVGGVAVLMLVRNAIRLMALQGKEESITLDKKNIAFTSVALILILISSTVIDKVLFVVDKTKYPVGGVNPAINPERGIAEIIGATNIVVTFVAPLAILVLIAGAIMYATAMGKEEQMNKAKRLMTMALIGIVLIFGAFAIISTIISGQFTA